MSELPSDEPGDHDLKKHLEDLVDHVHALKEQTSSMVGQGAGLGMGLGVRGGLMIWKQGSG